MREMEVRSIHSKETINNYFGGKPNQNQNNQNLGNVPNVYQMNERSPSKGTVTYISEVGVRGTNSQFNGMNAMDSQPGFHSPTGGTPKKQLSTEALMDPRHG